MNAVADSPVRNAGAFPPVSDAEHAARLAALRRRMQAQNLDLVLVSQPDNIFYLTGLDHWGYFVPHLLIVPADGEPTLVTRAMEKVTIANQVRGARFVGHSDSETAADAALRVIAPLGKSRRVGIESWSSGLPHGLAQRLAEGLPQSEWIDVTGLVDSLRRVKSPAEQAFMREAARLSDVAAGAAIEAIRDGAREADIAAECQRAMTAAGGTYPGFGPFIRPGARLGEEHTSWGGGVVSKGDTVFLELSGCFRRYHAPLGRLIHIGTVPDGTQEMEGICRRAFCAVLGALKPGRRAREVYDAWHSVVDGAGLGHYRRHHCGYVVGIGVPPSWTGGNSVTGLRHDSDLPVEEGMSFHILSWLMDTGRGDYFVSNTVLLTATGPEVLTLTPDTITLR
jgi:Xaa-Pro dipeptidase